MKKGKFIVIYGINNLGKSTQSKLLVKAIKKAGKKAEYIKYPIYDSEPAGKLINEYLRKGNPQKFTPREFQLLHFIDRKKHEEILKNKLAKGINIIAEDYFGTAMAWGLATGVDLKFLEYLNGFILKEDAAFFLDGKRFREAEEKNHKHEENEKLMEKARKAHLKIGKKYDWQKIDVSLPLERKHEIIWRKVRGIL
jgi:thymidylate kinase